jgi:hypothetical protein
MLHSPFEYGSAGFVPLSVHAGVGQILHFIHLWRSSHLVEGIFLQIVTRANQRQGGIFTFILQDTATRLPQVEAKCLMALRSFLASIEGTIASMYANHIRSPTCKYDGLIIVGYIWG